MFRKRLLRPLAVGIGVVALQLLSATSAFAHFVTITAVAGCIDSNPVISYTVGSWNTEISGSNSQVDVLFNNVIVDSQSFVLPTNSFSGAKPASSTGVVTVTANAVAAWGDGYIAPRSASTQVTVPADCGEVTAFGRFTGGPNG